MEKSEMKMKEKLNSKKISFMILSFALFIVVFYFIKKYENKERYLFYKKYIQIEVGMTFYEVEKIMGRPYRMKWIDSDEVDKKVIKTDKALIADFRYVFWKSGTRFYFDAKKIYSYSDFVFLHDLH